MDSPIPWQVGLLLRVTLRAIYDHTLHHSWYYISITSLFIFLTYPDVLGVVIQSLQSLLGKRVQTGYYAFKPARQVIPVSQTDQSGVGNESSNLTASPGRIKYSLESTCR